jgi:uncharacterized protein (DUF1697 family)
MKTYLAILRGINVSGQKLIKMEILRSLFEDLGFTLVKSYIQSGNVVFQSTLTTTSELKNKIETAILNQFGFSVPTLILEKDAVKTVLESNPFINQNLENTKDLYVTFLGEIPATEQVQRLMEQAVSADEFRIIDTSVYVKCWNGYGNTKLSNAYFESKLKIQATTRNWKTIQELFKMMEA